MSGPPFIVLLHATPVAMAPIVRAFDTRWPDAVVSHLLDESLTYERAKTAYLTEALIDRFVRFSHYAYESRPDAVLATCSAFGPAIDRAANTLPIPVCKPNEAMFRNAIARGNRIAMIATFGPSVVTMEQEFRREAGRLNSAATLTTFIVPEAMQALRAGEVEAHNQLIAARAGTLREYDAILLAHFSTSSALTAVNNAVDCPVYTAPESAVLYLRSRLDC